MERRKAIFENDFVKIPWGTTGYFIIDLENYEKVKDYDWFFHQGKFRSKSYKRGVSWYLHHLLFEYVIDGRKLQYRDGNIFNYQKQNLFFIGGKVEKLNC